MFYLSNVLPHHKLLALRFVLPALITLLSVFFILLSVSPVKAVANGCDDADADGWCDYDDNCPVVFNPEQYDEDMDSIGDACDFCPLEDNYEPLTMWLLPEEGYYTTDDWPGWNEVPNPQEITCIESCREYTGDPLHELCLFDHPDCLVSPHGLFLDCECGDGIEGPFEECDDGNRENGDGCDSECQLEGVFSFYINVWNGTDWIEVGMYHYPKSLTEHEFDLSEYLPNANGEMRVRIVQQGSQPAHIDHLSLNGIAPKFALKVNELTDVTRKLSTADFDVIDATNAIIDVTWAPMKSDKLILSLTAREESPKEVGLPYRYPERQLYEANEFVTYKLGTGSTETPVFSELASSSSGHPDGYVYGYVSNDKNNLYVTMDVTPDNTIDENGDWAKIHVKVGDETKVFLVDDNNTDYGYAEFVYNDKVVYEHKVYHFTIPLNELGNQPSLELAFETYGTFAVFLPDFYNEFLCTKYVRDEGYISPDLYDTDGHAITIVPDHYGPGTGWPAHLFAFNLSDADADMMDIMEIRVIDEATDDGGGPTIGVYIFNYWAYEWEMVGMHGSSPDDGLVDETIMFDGPADMYVSPDGFIYVKVLSDHTTLANDFTAVQLRLNEGNQNPGVCLPEGLNGRVGEDGYLYIYDRDGNVVAILPPGSQIDGTELDYSQYFSPEGYLIVDGIVLPEGKTKTVFIDPIAHSDALCIFDVEGLTIGEMRADLACSEGTSLLCPGSAGGYTCTVEEGRYRVDGLEHSGLIEMAGTGGTGGGGGGVAFMLGNLDFWINDGAGVTTSREVTLSFNVANATHMALSNDPAFAGVDWQDYVEEMAWTLESGDGVKTVYAYFMSSTSVSPMVADTIRLEERGDSALTMGISGVLMLLGALFVIMLDEVPPANTRRKKKK